MSSILLQPKSPKVGSNWRAERGTISDFLTSIVAKHQKFEREFFFEKSLTMPKKLKGGTFQSRPVLYVKRKNLFGSVRYSKWFNLTP